MKKLFTLALVISMSALVNSVFAFAKYVDITIQNYTGNEVANFPVLVKIDAPSGFGYTVNGMSCTGPADVWLKAGEPVRGGFEIFAAEGSAERLRPFAPFVRSYDR